MQRIVRIGLIIGMFVTAYLLILAWQKDYGSAPQQTSQAPAKQIAPQAANNNNNNINSNSDIPTTPAAPVNSDIPVAPVPVASTTAAAPVVATTSQDMSGLISVTTDIYQLYIDPKGGDIVHLDLLGHKQNNQTDTPFTLLENDANRIFVAQTGIIGVNGPDASPSGRPVYTSAAKVYKLTAGQTSLSVPLTFTDANKVSYTKTFTFKAGLYPIDVTYHVANNGTAPWSGLVFGQLKRDNSADPSKSSQGIMSVGTFLGGAWGMGETHYKKVNMADFGGEKALNVTGKAGYIAIAQHYFVASWIPDPTQAVQFDTRVANDNHIIEYKTNASTILAGQSADIQATFYAGPKVQSVLEPLANGLDKTVDYGILWPIAKPLFWCLNKIHGYVGNWGWAIILLTVAVKLILWPLASTSYRSMAKMKLIAPQMQAMKEQYGDDRARFAQEMMALYKKEKVSPLAGCLPMLLQMPIFMALYWVFMESVELRHAPWIGWIHDLSSMDTWFVLPPIMGVTMFMQQQLNPQPADPMQAKMMKIMPLAFTGFMLWFPAGLVLYWCVNNLLTILQQWYINRDVQRQKAAEAV